ncbi:hypothetical protein DJ73_11415 [Halorubrum sp. Ea1]|uniref:hypothetical protein n=1 Tax=Halorubrum sp. Ea1 TaxID=1480718 RepID=UPI000B999C1A|nr:hypothetical protein [Halorubrum sp. Ea1]OYR52110.1 hypothetical protein DJ73_11415 [Halorubrum sp. Ea1]
MRNPWVHDDVPEAAGSGYGGRVRLLGAVVWGTLLCGVGGTALLVGTGTVEPALAASLRSAVTYVLAGAASVLLLPLVLRLLAVSRLLAAVAFLAGAWLVGGFVWSRESERILGTLPGEGGLGPGAESFSGLFELAETLFALL